MFYIVTDSRGAGPQFLEKPNDCPFLFSKQREKQVFRFECLLPELLGLLLCLGNRFLGLYRKLFPPHANLLF